jgi:hypothetical protein
MGTNIKSIFTRHRQSYNVLPASLHRSSLTEINFVGTYSYLHRRLSRYYVHPIEKLDLIRIDFHFPSSILMGGACQDTCFY